MFLCRSEDGWSKRNKKSKQLERTNEKSDFERSEASHEVVRYRTEQSSGTKKEEKQLVWGRRKLSLPPSRTNLSFKKRARAKSGESVFLVVGKYHLWYLTLTRTLVVVKEKEIARGARAFFARGKAGGAFLFRFLFSRRTSYQVG